MAGPSSHATTNLPIQNLLNLPLETSIHLPTCAATSVDVQAAAFHQDSADSYYTAFYSQTQAMTDSTDTRTDDYYDDEDTDKSNNSEDNEANAPIKTTDGKWRCGWFDKKKKSTCDKTWVKMCDLT